MIYQQRLCLRETMTSAHEEIWCECSDDEKYNPCKAKKGTWEPKPEDILKIFEELKTNKVLKLSWSCPGRRPPNSEDHKVEVVKQELQDTPKKLEEKKPSIPNEFDFDDDDIPDTRTMLTPRRTPGSTPKSQKKVARMDKVLKDVMYQRKVQAAEREARKLAGAKSPRTGSPARAQVGSPAGFQRSPVVSHMNRQSPSRFGSAGDPFQSNTVKTPFEQDSVTRIAKSENSINSVNVSLSRQEPSAAFTQLNVSTFLAQQTESPRNQISIATESVRNQNVSVMETSRSTFVTESPRIQNTLITNSASVTTSREFSNPLGNNAVVVSHAPNTNGNTSSMAPVPMQSSAATQFGNGHQSMLIEKMDTS